jgi:hypothetical protein
VSHTHTDTWGCAAELTGLEQWLQNQGTSFGTCAGLCCFAPSHAVLCHLLQVGGIRRIVVPVELGYPNDEYKTIGPKPTTFAVSTLHHSAGHVCM